MRISVWSSDVCSSDLSSDPAVILREGPVRNDAWSWTPGGTIYLSTTPGGLTQTAPSATTEKVQQVGFALTDRKSVVSGKSVSVRVDLGGRCIIKKNNTRTSQYTTTHKT